LHPQTERKIQERRETDKNHRIDDTIERRGILF